MLKNSEDLFHFQLKAKDKEVGHCQDILFSDNSWEVKYIVVNAGEFLHKKKVLVPPKTIERPDWGSHEIVINLTDEELKSSPLLDEHQPVSKQLEDQLMTYYRARYQRWQGYWEETNVPPPVLPTEGLTEESEETHLRSVKELDNYAIHATDGNIGHVEGFLFDESWHIRYIIINIRMLGLTVREIIFSPKWVTKIDWATEEIYIDHSIADIKKSPSYKQIGRAHV